MDETIKQYRQKHKKCKFCTYLHYDSKPEILNIGSGFFECRVKDKIIRSIEIPRLCKSYVVNE